MTIEEEIEKNAKDLPIYKKGMEIYDVIDQVCQVIENDRLFLGKEKDAILNTAKLLSVKVVAIECEQCFDSIMHNAAIIRRAGFELSYRIDSLEAYGFEHVEYLEIVRPLILEYRLLYNDWMATTGKWDKNIDLWELITPHGAGPANIY